MKRLNIYFFGDSICFGQGVSIHKAWVGRLSAWLEERYGPAGYDVLVQSYSINGNTTRMALERIAYDIQGKDIDLLVVQFGINDANIWKTDMGNPRVSMQGFKANLQEIVDRVRAFGIKRVILNTNHRTARHEIMPFSEIALWEHVAAYNEVVRSVAAENAGYVVLMDMEQQVEQLLAANSISEESYLLPDKVHLSVKGNEVYYDAFRPTLEKVLDGMMAEGVI